MAGVDRVLRKRVVKAPVVGVVDLQILKIFQRAVGHLPLAVPVNHESDPFAVEQPYLVCRIAAAGRTRRADAYRPTRGTRGRRPMLRLCCQNRARRRRQLGPRPTGGSLEGYAPRYASG